LTPTSPAAGIESPNSVRPLMDASVGAGEEGVGVMAIASRKRGEAALTDRHLLNHTHKIYAAALRNRVKN